MTDFDPGTASGSELRQKYEEALQELKALKPEVAKYKAAEVISEKKFTLVKPDDLKGVAPDKLEEEAQRIHDERRELQKDLARDLFKRQGFEDNELEAVVDEYMEGRVPTPASAGVRQAEALESVRALEKLDARPIGYEDTSKLTGIAAIEHGLAKNQKQRR